jgi:hypothetical protein
VDSPILDLRNINRTGKIIAYIDTEGMTYSDKEQENLSNYNTQYCQTIADLFQILNSPIDTTSVIYLATHGIFTYNNKHEIAVGSLHNPTQRLVSIDLESINQPLESRPIVFINACHSARLMKDTFGMYGLPEIALARMAEGYIGTVGPVGSNEATYIAEEILKAASSPQGILIVDVLHKLRTQATRNLMEQPTEENWLMFLYTYMYVYYGNPFIRLIITKQLSGEIDNGE